MKYGAWDEILEKKYKNFEVAKLPIETFTRKQTFTVDLVYVFYQLSKGYLSSFSFYFKGNNVDEICWLSVSVNEHNKTYSIFTYCLTLDPDSSNGWQLGSDHFPLPVMSKLVLEIATFLKFHSEKRLELLFDWRILDARNPYDIKDLTNV